VNFPAYWDLLQTNGSLSEVFCPNSAMGSINKKINMRYIFEFGLW